MSKKFEILNTGADKKRFDILWHQQQNPSDCGPMAVLNALIRVNFPNRPTSVKQVRDAVAEQRLHDGQSTEARVGGEVRTTGWLTSRDLGKYLQHLNINSEVLSNIPDIARVKEELFNNPNKFYILATGNHFKVIRYTGQEENFELLDSFQSGPQRLSKQEAYDLLDESVGLAGILAG